MYKFFLTLAFAAVALSGTAKAAPIVIDNFGEPPSVSGAEFHAADDGLLPINDLGLLTTNVVGGSRVGSVQSFLGSPTLGDSVTLTYGSGFGSHFTVATAGTGTTDVNLMYDANGAGLALDLSSQVGIMLDFSILDAAAIGTTFTLDITDVTATTFSETLTATTGGPQTFDFLFSLPGYAGLDTSTIDTIELNSSVPANGDIRISNIQSIENVPEPGSLAIWGLIGIAGAFGFWRMRRKVGR